MRDFGVRSVRISGTIHNWKDKLANEILDLNNSVMDRLFVVTTHDTLYHSDFFGEVQKADCLKMLIADEVHGLGSSQRRNGLRPFYEIRLGLSATPSRWFDEEGTGILEEFFGGTVFTFPLSEAIPKYLVPYEYHPHFVELTAREFEKYLSMTHKIASRLNHLEQREDRIEEILKLYLIKRQKIVVDAREKFHQFKTILDSMEQIDHCLVYCSPEQIAEVQAILNEKGVIQHKFTFRESMKQRAAILRGFNGGKYQALVAIRCLDEGLDVPSTRTAILLASSTNPMQYIQRRGRILRRHPGKDNAVIHDIVVFPGLCDREDRAFEIERKIVINELRRYIEFSTTSMNPNETLEKLQPILDQYAIDIEEEIING
jgi:superfamily II DNA or RNA helicase